MHADFCFADGSNPLNDRIGTSVIYLPERTSIRHLIACLCE